MPTGRSSTAGACVQSTRARPEPFIRSAREEDQPCESASAPDPAAPAGRPVVLIALSLVALIAGPVRAEDYASIRPREAVAPIAPVLPEVIVSAIQESRFDAAIAPLDALVRDRSKPADDRAFFGWIKGIVLRRAGRLDEAAAAIRSALHDFPGSAWAGKLRGELAGVELAQAARRGRTARPRRGRGLAEPRRKDRLAAVVEDFAGRLLQPGDPLVKPEPEGAYALLSMARGLARGDEARARILFTMARASRAAGNLERAVADLRRYLAEYPRGADRAQVSYQLGEVLWHGQGHADAAPGAMAGAGPPARGAGAIGRRGTRPPRPMPVPGREILPGHAQGQ